MRSFKQLANKKVDDGCAWDFSCDLKIAEELVKKGYNLDEVATTISKLSPSMVALEEISKKLKTSNKSKSR